MKENRDRNIFVKKKETRDNLMKLLREEKTYEDKGECIVNYLLCLGEPHEKKATLACKKCLTSFYSGFQFPVPTNYDTIRWKLISESPKSILSRKDLEEIVGKHVKYIDEPQKNALCSWSLYYVQVCMVLLSHAFHCPGVQCYLMQDRSTWSKEDCEEQEKIEQKQQEYPTIGEANDNHAKEPIVWGSVLDETEKVPLPRAVDTLLIICQNTNHYAVMKILPKEHIVLIWDAAAESPREIERSWKIHAIRALKMHVPEMVREDELNIFTETEQSATNFNDWIKAKKTRLKKDNYKTITVRGMYVADGHHQIDEYTCGSIAINRFASLLKEINESLKPSLGDVGVDAVLLAKIKSPDELKGDNHHNAAVIFQYILENMGDALSYPDDGNEDRNHSKKNNVGTKDNPINLDDTPIELFVEVGEDEDDYKTADEGDDALADGSTKEENTHSTEDASWNPQSKNTKLQDAHSKMNSESNVEPRQRSRRLTTLQKTQDSNERIRTRMESKDIEIKRKCGAGTRCRMM